MTVTQDQSVRRLALFAAVVLVGAVAGGCARADRPAQAAASPTSPTARPGEAAHQRGGPGYVRLALPMGSWLSLDHALEQPEAAPAPKGVTPNLTYNLDEGVETLVTDFGEQLAWFAHGEPTYSDCLRATYSADDVVDLPQLPPGTWFCAKDRSGRLAKLRIDGVDEDKAALRLAYKVWK